MAFLGLRSTVDWAANERPENWRESMLLFFPNGDMPLTGLTSLSGADETDDPHIHWFTKVLPEQAGTVTNVYKDVGLTVAYVGGDAFTTGQTVFVKAAEEVISEFRIGFGAKLRKGTDYRVDTQVEITDRVLNGADSYVAAKLIEDASALFDLNQVDRIAAVGNANAEGAEMPDAVSYDPNEFDNLTQIFRDPLSITRTARKTRYRTGDKYQELKRETLQTHGVGIEKTLIWGVKYSTIGQNGKPKRYADGVINFTTTHAPPDNIDDFSLNPNYSGQTWLQGGEEWLDEKLEAIYRRGMNEKLGLCGSTTLRAINQLAKISGDIQLTPMTTEFGMQVKVWLIPYGTLILKLHPLFSHEVTNRRSMLILEPSKIITRTLDDTMFIEDPQDRKNRNNSRDGTEEEYLSELTWEFHEPAGWGYLNGFGLNNNV